MVKPCQLLSGQHKDFILKHGAIPTPHRKKMLSMAKLRICCLSSSLHGNRTFPRIPAFQALANIQRSRGCSNSSPICCVTPADPSAAGAIAPAIGVTPADPSAGGAVGGGVTPPDASAGGAVGGGFFFPWMAAWLYVSIVRAVALLSALTK